MQSAAAATECLVVCHILRVRLPELSIFHDPLKINAWNSHFFDLATTVPYAIAQHVGLRFPRGSPTVQRRQELDLLTEEAKADELTERIEQALVPVGLGDCKQVITHMLHIICW